MAPGSTRPIGTCDSCGSVEEVTRVHRVYVTPESWDTEGRAEAQADTEQWCFACTTHYPHQPADG